MRLLLLVLLMLVLTIFPAYADELVDARNAYTGDDYKAALGKFIPLAEQGNAEAQFFLGLMYHLGKGVPKDFVQAHKWYNLSASGSQGETNDKPVSLEGMHGKRLTLAQVHYISTNNLNAIEKEMTRAQIEEAKKLALEWKPKPAQ